jgi:hypothetical protein
MPAKGKITFEVQKDFYPFPDVQSDPTATAEDGSVIVTLKVKLDGPLYPVLIKLTPA